MSFLLLAAVDVADGESVRLVQGEAADATIYGDPLDAALRWQTAGAEWIHLVDLDAAFGRGANADLLASVIEDLDAQVELSGGICDDASLERALATNCDRVVLSTAALHDPMWCERVIDAHGERIAVALDVLVDRTGDSVRHRLAARGSTTDVGDLWETIERLDRHGCARYVVTDVHSDGMLCGPNMDLYQAVLDATATPVIASGGVSSIADLVVLAEAARTSTSLEGSIVGKALYAGRFVLADALDAVRNI